MVEGLPGLPSSSSRMAESPGASEVPMLLSDGGAVGAEFLGAPPIASHPTRPSTCTYRCQDGTVRPVFGAVLETLPGYLVYKKPPPPGPYSRPMPGALWWSMGGWRFLMSEVPLYKSRRAQGARVCVCSRRHTRWGRSWSHFVNF